MPSNPSPPTPGGSFPRWRKKPVVVDAIQVPLAGEEIPEAFWDWCAEHDFDALSDRDEGISIETLEGTMRADPGDWIIKGIKGEFYPCKPDVFAATYEKVTPDV